MKLPIYSPAPITVKWFQICWIRLCGENNNAIEEVLLTTMIGGGMLPYRLCSVNIFFFFWVLASFNLALATETFPLDHDDKETEWKTSCCRQRWQVQDIENLLWSSSSFNAVCFVWFWWRFFPVYCSRQTASAWSAKQMKKINLIGGYFEFWFLS